MSLTLPRLDDRRWADLVAEGRSLLPLYAPQWTDHNLSDPGITLMELFAWIAEMGLYRLDRVPAAHRLRFLALLGEAPRPPRGAEVTVGFGLASGGPSGSLALPAGLVLEASNTAGGRVLYATVAPVVVAAGRLAALQAVSGNTVRDLTPAWRRGEPLAAFGDDPAAGSALYLGFTEAPKAGEAVSIHFEVEGGGADERWRLEKRERERDCGGRGGECEKEEGQEERPCAGEEEELQRNTSGRPLVHHSVRLSWEMATAGGAWRRLDPAAGEVEDDTRGLTLSGRVTVRLPAPPAAVRVGEVESALPYVRSRVVGGAYDAPPRLLAVVFNGVRARQEVPVGAVSWTLTPDAVVEGPPPVPGATARFDARFAADGQVTHLVTDARHAPELVVLEWRAPSSPAVSGRLSVEAVVLGRGTGRPNQALELPERLPAGRALTVSSLEEGRLRTWRRVSDFDASGRGDAHFVVEPRPEDSASGVPLARVRFGDGERGRLLPEAAPAWTAYQATLGPGGEVGASAFAGLADVPGNRARVTDLDAVAARLAGIENPLASAGGSAGETIDAAARRVLESVERTERAVTRADYERLALATPGVRLARAEARAERHPAFPCYPAPGVVTVLVLPYLPTGRPAPSRGLLAAVASFLNRRRVLGTRVEVAGPAYVEVRVRARVKARPGVSRYALAQRLRSALDAFFHPLTGGPEGSGWSFGRTVYMSEVYQVLDETEGADHVVALELVGPDDRVSCDNLCMPPDGLPAAGAHEVTVEGGGDPC